MVYCILCVHVYMCRYNKLLFANLSCKCLASLTIAFSESSLWIELMYYINLVQC